MEWNKACLPCRLVHTTCDGKRPCRRCVKLGKPSTCINVEKKRRGRPPKNKNLNAAAPAAASAMVSTRPTQSPKNERAARAKSEAARKSLPVNQYDYAFNYEGGRRRSSRRASTRGVEARVQSPPASSDEGEENNHSEDEEEDDDDDYFGEDRHRRAVAMAKKRKSPPAKTLPSTVKTTSDFVTKRPRVEPHEHETTPAHSGPVSPATSNNAVCVDDEQLPLLLDPSYAWIDDLDPTGEMTNADSFLPLDLFSLSLPDSLASSPATPPPSMLPLPPAPTMHNISREPPPPASPSPSFEFRDGFADEYNGLDECHAEDGHDHDHDCTCSSPHSFSGDAVDTELVNSLFGMVSDQVGELKKANQDLRQSIDTLWQSFNERLEREEKRVNDLHQLVVATRLSPAEGTDPALGRSTRWEVLRELPFLLDWADDIDFANPDGFVIDDMSKPFIVRRLASEPMLDPSQSLPVSVYASPAFCNFIRAPSHDIVGTLCYKAQEEPLRWFLAKKSSRPVGELCYLPLTRQIGERTVQSLTKNQLFYDRNGTAKWWILVVEQFMLLGETTTKVATAVPSGASSLACPTGNPGETSEEEEQRQRCHHHDAKLALGAERLTDLRPPLEQQLLS